MNTASPINDPVLGPVKRSGIRHALRDLIERHGAALAVWIAACCRCDKVEARRKGETVSPDDEQRREEASVAEDELLMELCGFHCLNVAEAAVKGKYIAQILSHCELTDEQSAALLRSLRGMTMGASPDGPCAPWAQ